MNVYKLRNQEHQGLAKSTRPAAHTGIINRLCMLKHIHEFDDCKDYRTVHIPHKRREPLRDFPNTYLEVTSVRDFKNFKWIDLGNLAQMKRQQVTKLNEM